MPTPKNSMTLILCVKLKNSVSDGLKGQHQKSQLMIMSCGLFFMLKNVAWCGQLCAIQLGRFHVCLKVIRRYKQAMMTTFNKKIAIHMEEQGEKEIARVMGNVGSSSSWGSQ